MDYAAFTPETKKAGRIRARIGSLFGNPSSIHADGVRAKLEMEYARTAVANILHAQPDEIIFTATGTESDNLAILGVFNQAIGSGVTRPHIVTMVTEHPAVLRRYEYLASIGADVSYVPVGDDGRVNPKDVRELLRPDTIVVSIMYANNEIGTIQPINEIAKEIRHWRKENTKHQKSNFKEEYPLLHTDACQATQYLNMNVEQLGIDLLTFSGIKFGAGNGAGALYVRRGTPIAPIFYGGDQERGLRPGTENVPAIVAFATALVEAQQKKVRESDRLTQLRNYFFGEITARFPEARINGTKEFRLPNNVHVSFPNVTSELLVLELDAKGVSASAGSACSASDESESRVLSALYGVGDGKKWGSVRFSFGAETKKSDIDYTLKCLEKIMSKYQEYLH